MNFVNSDYVKCGLVCVRKRMKIEEDAHWRRFEFVHVVVDKFVVV